MSDTIQSIRAYALHHPDPRVRDFMQRRIQREIGRPPLPQIEPPHKTLPQMMAKPKPAADLPPVIERDGKWVGRPFDLEDAVTCSVANEAPSVAQDGQTATDGTSGQENPDSYCDGKAEA